MADDQIPSDVSPELRAIVETFNPDADTVEGLREVGGTLVPLSVAGDKAARLLAEYVLLKAYAMEHRIEGRISSAILLEGKCDKLYSSMPAWMRW